MSLKKKLDKSILVLIFIVIVVIVTTTFAYLQLRTDLFTEALKSGEPISILFALSGDQSYRFFELFIYHPDTHKAAIVFIPANLGLIIESLKRIDRIDTLYRPNNLTDLKRKTEEVTGVEISFVVDLQEENIIALVDLLGGLELFIPNPVDLNTQGIRTLLPSGSVVLSGDKIKSYISYRDSLEADIDWVGRKQKFLQVLLKKIGEKHPFLLHKDTFPYLQNFFKTSMGSKALASFIMQIENLDTERIIFQRVLGSTRVVDQQELLFPHFDGQLLKETIKQTMETIASSEMLAEEELSLSLEVLNGTSVTGLARRAANVFQSFGYDIVSVANADNDQYMKTVILDRKGKLEAAQRIAELIRCNRIFSRVENDGDFLVDITIILGKDFDGRYCKE
ncbi:MAG TPA: LytR family transcriptional regulator [bacterium]|nr:LytR family transcriptional regulator [bacterium]